MCLTVLLRQTSQRKVAGGCDVYCHGNWLAVSGCGNGSVFALHCQLGHGSQTDETLVEQALAMAVTHRTPPQGLLHHSDRGCQETSSAYQEFLKDHGMCVSMSRKGNCWDNAVMERFFGTLKRE
jgi:transposase InsO family protein